MKQGVLLPSRVRLLLSKGHSCYRPRRTGERKRKSVRGCIVASDMSVLSVTIVKQGEQDLPGLTDTTVPKRLGPKRANNIRKFFVRNSFVTSALEKTPSRGRSTRATAWDHWTFGEQELLGLLCISRPTTHGVFFSFEPWTLVLVSPPASGPRTTVQIFNRKKRRVSLTTTFLVSKPNSTKNRT
jgi:hypothetical protein